MILNPKKRTNKKKVEVIFTKGVHRSKKGAREGGYKKLKLKPKLVKKRKNERA